jgi:hypothetical protein
VGKAIIEILAGLAKQPDADDNWVRSDVFVANDNNNNIMLLLTVIVVDL